VSAVIKTWHQRLADSWVNGLGKTSGLTDEQAMQSEISDLRAALAAATASIVAQPVLAMDRRALLPCPFCGCSMSVRSNRDWHRPDGDHAETCPLWDSDLMFPATDHGMMALLSMWNSRAEAQQQDSERDAAHWTAPQIMDAVRKYGANKTNSEVLEILAAQQGETGGAK